MSQDHYRLYDKSGGLLHASIKKNDNYKCPYRAVTRLKNIAIVLEVKNKWLWIHFSHSFRPKSRLKIKIWGKN
jgi:hypothetical protein